MPAKKKIVRKKPSRGKVVRSSGSQGFAKHDSVISRRNQNGTVILMKMDRTSSFYKIDGIAAEVWSCFESSMVLRAVTDYFCKRYPAKSKSLGSDIDTLVKKLVKLELLSSASGPFNTRFPASIGPAKRATEFGRVQEFDLEQIESEVLNESVYLDVFAGSDLRLKAGVAPIRNALDKVTQLDGITHRWKPRAFPARARRALPRGQRAGLIAQQVAIHMPELVRADRETGYLAVEYQKLTSYLVEAIKELNRRLVTQEERIGRLTAARRRPSLKR